MIFATNRCTAPAAAPRTGRAPVALPSDPGLDRLLADPNLGSTAKTIALALVKTWAWSKPSCWPSDRTIAARIGKSPGHTQRCLRELEAAGYIDRQHTAEVPTGRRIWLAWRCPDQGKGAQPESAPARIDLSAPARTKQVVIVNERREPEEREISERPRPEPAPDVPAPEPELVEVVAPVETVARPSPAPRAEVATPATPVANPLATSPTRPLTPEQATRLAQLPAAARDQVMLWLALGDPILTTEAHRLLTPPRPRPEPPRTLPEALARIRECPTYPAMVADWLAKAFDDAKSYSGFKARCEEAWRGELEVSRLVDALRQATGPKARNPGAIFMHALRVE